jgi:hypothetical protein
MGGRCPFHTSAHHRILASRFLKMHFARLPLWCLVSVLILFVSPTTCDTLPEPLCHPALGRNLNSSHCIEAIQQFHFHKDEYLRSYNLARPYQNRFYFGNDLSARFTAGRFVRLPLYFSHQGCKITITIPANARLNPVSISWGSVSTAVGHVYRKCVRRIGSTVSTGGTMEYQGLEILIMQFP